MTEDMKTVLEALRSSVESIGTIKGEEWGTVYLDNAAQKGWSHQKFAGVLSALKKAGFYASYDDGEFDGLFGEVKMK